MRMYFSVLVGLITLVPTCCLGRQLQQLAVPYPKHSANYHNQDLLLFLGGYNNTTIGDIARIMSKDIDDAKWFREEVGNFKDLPYKGNHRNVGHDAPFGENIPRDSPSAVAIRKKYGESGITKVNAHQKVKGDLYTTEIMSKTGLSKRQARAFINLDYCFHNCGDSTIDNHILGLGMNFDDRCELAIDSLNDLFGRKDPNYFKNFKRRLLMIKNSQMSVRDKSFAFIKLFREMKFDEALNRNYGKKLEEMGIMYDCKEASKADRYYREKYKTQERAYGINKRPRQKNKVRAVTQHSGDVKLKNAHIITTDKRNRFIRQKGWGVRRVERYSVRGIQLRNMRIIYMPGAVRTLGGIGSAAMIAAPSLGGLRAGKTAMDVAVDAGVMLAGYSASQSASAMVAGTIGSGGAFVVAMVVQMVIAKIAYGFYERHQNVRREQRDIGVLKARIDMLNHDDGLLDRMVERAIDQKGDFN